MTEKALALVKATEKAKESTSQDSTQESTKPRKMRPRGHTDLVRDVLWVYDHLHRKRTPRPPSGGARALLAHARKDPQWFIDKMLPKALPKQVNQHESRAELEDDKAQKNLFERATAVIQEANLIYSG